MLTKKMEDKIHLTVMVTNICNLKCRYCFSVATGCNIGQTLAIDNVDAILSNIDIPISSISLSGGEPFLNSDLPTLYSIFSRHHETTITTNGTIEPPKGLGYLFDHRDLRVTISLNALSDEIDCLMRGTPSDIDKIVKNVRLLSMRSSWLKVNTIITRVNSDHAVDIGVFLAQLQNDKKLIWSIMELATNNVNVLGECSDLALNHKQFQDNALRLLGLFQGIFEIRIATAIDLQKRCYIITPVGELFNLGRSKLSLGNIFETNLSQLLEERE